MLSMANEKNILLEELKDIKKEIVYIKEHMIDVDSLLDESDHQALKEAEDDVKAGRTLSLEQVKKELGLWCLTLSFLAKPFHFSKKPTKRLQKGYSLK